MTQIACGGVLFDMDGVLIDSTPAVARVWAAWALAHGLDPDEVVKIAHGRPSLAAIRELLPNGDHAAEDREVALREIADVADVVALPGAKHLLEKLPADRIAMVTSATRPLSEVRLKVSGLPLLRHMVTAGDYRHGKPDPEPYLTGALRLGLAAADCVVLEDAPAGVRSGKAAGARVIALRTTTGDEALRTAGADWIVDDCASLSILAASNKNEVVLQFNQKK